MNRNIWKKIMFTACSSTFFVKTSKSRNSHKSTIDEKEVEYFSTQCREWWNVHGPLQMLHKMNNVRVPLFRDYLAPSTTNNSLPLKGMKVLDVGCGGGILSEGLATLGATVTGIDASPDVIKVAQEHAEANPAIADYKPSYYHTTIEDHADVFENHYDGIIASEVIEHVNNQELFVKACVKSLKPGGKIMFTTPNRTLWCKFMLIFFMENIIKTIPKGTHEFNKFTTPKELGALLEKYNCKVQYTTGLTPSIRKKKWFITESQKMIFVLQAVKDPIRERSTEDNYDDCNNIYK